MKTIYLLAAMTVLFSLKGLSLTYYTINDGNWSNTTDVWSTDGTNPCYCAPSFTLNSDTVIIRNNIGYDNHLLLQADAVLRVTSGAALVNPLLKITVRKGALYSNGIITTKELNIQNSGMADLFSAVLNIEGQMNVYGPFTSNFSNVYISVGNIEVGNTGSFLITNSTKVFFTLGNFNNSGITTLMDNSCIQLTSGNFKNFSGGTFNGNGSVITDAGNIINEGTWGNDLKWCAVGTTFGITTPENCTGSYAACSFAPLSAELLSFNVVPQEGSNLINWYTYSEESGEYYVLERSKDGNNWEKLGEIEARNPGAEVTHYVFIDERPISGLSYYKLTLITTDGGVGFTAILGVNSENLDEVVVFPNPTSDHITVRFSRPLENVQIFIADASGQIKEVYHNDSMIEETFHLPYPCGMYFVKIESESFREVIKVIKR